MRRFTTILPVLVLAGFCGTLRADYLFWQVDTERSASIDFDSIEMHAWVDGVEVVPPSADDNLWSDGGWQYNATDEYEAFWMSGSLFLTDNTYQNDDAIVFIYFDFKLGDDYVGRAWRGDVVSDLKDWDVLRWDNSTPAEYLPIVVTVPEPGSGVLMLLGAALLALRRRRGA